MRTALKEKEGSRNCYVGIFNRFGTKPSYRGFPQKTCLLLNVRDAAGKLVTDHLWFNFTKGFEEANLSPGDTVQFWGKAQTYEKGYKGNNSYTFNTVSKDFKLSRPTKIKNLGKI